MELELELEDPEIKAEDLQLTDTSNPHASHYVKSTKLITLQIIQSINQSKNQLITPPPKKNVPQLLPKKVHRIELDHTLYLEKNPDVKPNNPILKSKQKKLSE